MARILLNWVWPTVATSPVKHQVIYWNELIVRSMDFIDYTIGQVEFKVSCWREIAVNDNRFNQSFKICTNQYLSVYAICILTIKFNYSRSFFIKEYNSLSLTLLSGPFKVDSNHPPLTINRVIYSDTLLNMCSIVEISVVIHYWCIRNIYVLPHE